ncbi:hypothetical protein [Cellulomonas sp. KRMCY2]|uniref:hypothetical protein n=1 Tax=Cellulomonas sp. KRMCY2 TaxID=1304865 RepID=UPI00045EBBAB|nr:hypothetical protein [Cellulomonas sp. KRMCY2]
MSLTQAAVPGTRDPGDARAARRILRAEKAQVLRWRRLLRARLDLAVAAFAPPEALGGMSWELLPDAQLGLPTHRDLIHAVTVPAPSDPVALMEHLRLLDRELAAYGSELDCELENRIQSVLDQLAGTESLP